MDHQERIARAEAFMETNRQDIDRLYQAISELRKLILERTDDLRAGFKEQRDYMDNRFKEQRDYMDWRFDQQGKAMEDGFKEVRREASVNQRWMIGLTLVNTTMILGLGGKLFGVY